MEFVEALVDKTPYRWWSDGESTLEDGPFYCKKIPSIETIQKSGCNCAGLINILQLCRGLVVPGVKINHFYAGGTYAWYEYLSSINALEPVNRSKSYPKGSLLLRRYRDVKDQGHLAVLYTSGILTNQKLLHCYYNRGITIDESFQDSDSWCKDGYYEYICVNWFYADLLQSEF
jgi:hypothetical protein